MTGRPIRIWRVLGVLDWWWLMFASMFEAMGRHALHAPGWIPSLIGIWVFLQAAWLKRAEPASRTIYLYLASITIELILAIPTVGKLPEFALDAIGLIGLAVWLTGIFIFRDEMRKHFTLVDPRGLELNGFMTFFFNVLYFQYWFREIYREQTDQTLSLTLS